jgi:hypothetical protein
MGSPSEKWDAGSVEITKGTKLTIIPSTLSIMLLGTTPNPYII